MWEQDLKFAEIGEAITWNILSNNKNVKSIVDVRKAKRFQSVDVDFLIQNVDLQILYIEVKTDRQAHNSGNIVYEISTSGNIGCFAKTKADFVYYFIPGDNELLVLNVKGLRDYIDSTPLYQKKMGDNAEGFLIPIANIINNKNVVAHVYREVV